MQESAVSGNDLRCRAMNRRTGWRQFLRFCIALCVFLFHAGASLQTIAAPALLPGKSEVPKTESAGKVETSKEDLDAVRDVLETTRSELAAIDASSGHALNAPPGATEEQLQQRRYLMREIIRASEQTLANNGRLAGLRKQNSDMQKAADAWSDFEMRPPYSVLFVDKLMEDADAIERRLKATNAEYASFSSFRDYLTRAMKTNAAQIRREEEVRQSAKGVSGDAASALWALDLLRLRARAQEAILRELESSGETIRLDAARAGIELKLAQRKVSKARADVHFPQADFQRLRNDLEAESRDASSRLAKLFGEPEESKRKQEIGRNEALRKSDVPAVSGGGMLDAFRLLPTIIEIKRATWDFRYQLYNQRSPELIASAAGQQLQFANSLNLFAANVARQLQSSVDVAVRIESLLMAAESSALRAALRQQLEDSVKRRKYLQDTATAVDSAQFIVARLGEELGSSKASMSVKDQAKTVANTASDLLGIVWNFELFTAENTIEVDGRKLTGISSITIGKIVRALALFTLGVMVALWGGRIAEEYVVRRFCYDATRARILRKWLLTFGLLVLVVAVLMWVNIPLSVFAFLGGAIAIGVGFGMQNLLKNLISGLMLLFEQPFKPGDIVQVGSIRGVITEIGIRSSIIRDGNGIDTLIPNSVFVEENVTNWMYENRRVRFSIRLGVAYGTPARDMVVILEDCARRHGLVLKEPAPLVLFEDFGADALQFAVYYWVEIGPTTNPNEIASDLRFIIEKEMTERGIVIAYPQRDVHLDAASPLKIEVVRNGKDH